MSLHKQALAVTMDVMIVYLSLCIIKWDLIDAVPIELDRGEGARARSSTTTRRASSLAHGK